MLSIENCVRLFPEGINTQRLPALKEFNAKLTKGFGLGGLDLTAYLDVRNLFNWKNVIQVFAVNGDTRNDQERADNLLADLNDLATERDANEAVGPSGGASCFRRRTRTATPGSPARRSARPRPTACT